MTALRWADWVRAEMDRRGWSSADAARASGVHHTAFSEWLRPDAEREPSVTTVRKVTQAFGRPVLEGLVAAGYITEDETQGRMDGWLSITEMPTLDLIDEIRRRVLKHERSLDDRRRGSDDMPPPQRRRAPASAAQQERDPLPPGLDGALDRNATMDPEDWDDPGFIRGQDDERHGDSRDAR